MADQSSEGVTARRTAVDIKLLGPAQEFSPPGIQLSEIPISTTIAELKSRINQTVDSRPPVETLRIISHGRACRDNEQIGDIFARTSAPNDSAFRVLHVVVTDPSHPRAPHLLSPRSHSVPSSNRTYNRGGLDDVSHATSPGGVAVPSLSVPQHQVPHPLASQVTAASHLQPTNSEPPAHHGQLHNPRIMPGTSANNAHGSDGVPQAIDPAELLNGLINQQVVLNQHLMAMQGHLPQMFHNLPPFAPNAGNAVGAQTPGLTDPGEAARSTASSQVQGAHAQTVPNNAAETLDTTLPLPTSANVAAESQPQPSLASHLQPNVNASRSTTQEQPSSNTQHITGVDSNGRQFTMTVQNSVFNFPPGQHPPAIPNFLPQFVMPINPQMAGGHSAGVRLPQAAVPLRPRSTPLPVSVPPTANGPAPMTVRMPDSERNGEGDVDNRILRLSVDLFNISRRIQMLGARLATPHPHGSLRPSMVRESINYLQAVEELDFLLRGFDNQVSHFLTMHPEATSDAQYLQTQSRRRGAGAAVARIYELVRNEVMTPTLRPMSSISATPVASTATTQRTRTIGHAREQQSEEQPAQTSASRPAMPVTSSTPQIYVLNDPNGAPYALLVGPSGQQSSQPLPWNILRPLLASHMPAVTLARAIHQAAGSSYAHTVNDIRFSGAGRAGDGPLPDLRNLSNFSNAHVHGANSVHGNEEHANNQANPAVAADVMPVQPAREPDEMRDLLAPVIRNLWLLLRIAGFAYFLFGGGRALWRPLVLAGILTIVWAAQAGIFGDRFDAVRRYLDRLVGTDPNARADANNRGIQHRAQPPTGQIDGDQRAPSTEQQASEAGPSYAEPRLDDTAARLRTQHEVRRETTWLLQQIRYVERMFGLFLASLWPGIGEQAVRLQEERERRVREAAEALAASQAAAALEAARENQEATKLEMQDMPGSSSRPANSQDPVPSDATAAEALTNMSSAVETLPENDNGLSRVNKGKGRAVKQSLDDT